LVRLNIEKMRKNRKEKERVRRKIKQVFRHYNKDALFEEEIYEYFMKNGLNKNEIKNLLEDALAYDIIDIGLTTLIEKEEIKTLEEIKTKKVYILKENLSTI